MQSSSELVILCFYVNVCYLAVIFEMKNLVYLEKLIAFNKVEV